MTLSVTDPTFELSVSRVLSPYAFDSLKTALQSLRQHSERLATENYPSPIQTNGFVNFGEYAIPVSGGNGLFSISIGYYPYHKSKLPVKIIDHATNEITEIGYFSAYGFHEVDQGCMPRPPRLLFGLTQNGSHLVLFGPQRYARSKFPNKNEAPEITIYQLAPPMEMFEKRVKNTPFIKCDPDGIALSPAGVTHGHYLVAIVTRGMAIILLNVKTLEHSSLQLESVQPQFDVQHEYSIKRKCIDFSPDGQFLSVMCFMRNESKNACLIIDVASFEPLCWMEADGTFMCLGWLFPMFSTCGTKLAVCAYPDFESMYDESKYEMKLFKISGIQSLKVLCRVAILECVTPSLVDQLPLPQNLIAFLIGSRTVQGLDAGAGHKESESKTTCKCTLL